MKIILPLFILVGFNLSAQIQADSITILNNPLTESSGLLVLDGTFITHNDSGNDAVLYEVDTLTGLPSRTVVVANATNIDWEDLAADADYLYVGDFGNNQGTRQNLRIYKIALADYWASDTVTADTINFSYADQTSFTPMPLQTNYDAEALICRGDSLFVFTKQWSNPGTRAYKIPKVPGTYSVSVYQTFSNFSGLVTGADYYQNTVTGLNTLALTINLVSNPMIDFYLDLGGAFGGNGYYSFFATVYGSIQVEGIALLEDKLYITSEAFAGQPGMLSRSTIPPFMAIEEYALAISLSIYPNPVAETMQVNLPQKEINTAGIYANDGKLVQELNPATLKNGSIRVVVPAGVYYVMIHFSDGSVGYAKFSKL